MQCLHCGKKLSLLRKLSDGRFCSDAHREEYERLEGDLALARLMGARGARGAQRKEKPVRGRTEPAGALLPMAPLLPESLRVANWRRVANPPLRLIGFRLTLSIPESPLRPVARGFPAAPPAEIGRPAGPWCRAVLALEAGPIFGLADSAGTLLTRRNPSSAGNGRECPPPFAGLAGIPLSPVASALPGASGPRAAWMARRKLVVIVPKPLRRLAHAGLRLAEVQPLALLPAAAGARVPGAFPEPRPAGSSGAPLLPRMGRTRSRPAVVPAAVAESPGLSAAAEPPLCCQLQAVSASGPAGIELRVLCPEPAWLPAGVSMQVPARPWRAVPPGLRISSLLPLAAAPCPRLDAASLRDADAGWESAEAKPCLPLSGLGPGRLSHNWPAWADLLPVGTQTAAVSLIEVDIQAEPLWTFAEAPLVAGRAAAIRPGLLRLAWRQAGIETRAIAAPLPQPGAFLPRAEWESVASGIPGSRLELIPPDPPPSPEPARDQVSEGVQPSLAALQAAVNGTPGAGPGTAGDPGAGVAGLPPGAVSTELRETVEQDSRLVAPPLARRVPEMPMRPVDRAVARPAPELPSTAAPWWASLDEPRPMAPRLRLELDHADGSGPRKRGESAARTRRSRKPAGTAKGRRFWSHAPSDLKWIAVVLPLLLLVVVYSFRSKAPNHPPEGREMSATATAPAAPAQQEGSLNALQRIILRRAAIRLFDDFRGGLSSWEGRDGWAKTWRYGDATFIEPGDLALLTPSLSMADYTLTFLGQIERRSLNWVFRARDLNNYYAMRIVITRGGPLPEAAVVRSVVINGKEQDVRTMPIPFPVRADTLYLVRMEVRGQDFTTYIQNQVVDHFSDSRLKRGGIGFYSPKGDRALLRWVEVSHQYDYLGRLCALLAPYGVQNFAAN